MSKKSEKELNAKINELYAEEQLKEIQHHDLIESSMEQQDLPLVESGRDVDRMEAVEVGLDETGEKRGRGRPKGSKNKRTEDWTEYLLNNYRSPLIMFAETYSRPTAALALELRCTFEEAFKIQMDAAKQLAPYVHQKLPQAIEIEGDKGLINLTMVVTEAYAAIQSNTGIKIIDAETVEIEEPKNIEQKQ